MAVALIRIHSRRELLKWIVVLVLVVLVASAFRRAVSLPEATAVVVWPTVGLLAGFLLVTEVRYWWLICVLTFSVEYPFAIGSFSYELQQSTLTKVATYYGLLIFGCWVLRQRHPEGMELHRLTPDLRDFFVFVVLFCLCLALLEPYLVSMAGGVSFAGLGWYHWALSNAASIFVWAPAVVAWLSRPANWRSMQGRAAIVELLALALVIGGLVFASGHTSAAVSQSLYDLVWIPLLIAVFRFDLRSVTLLTVWVSVIVSVALIRGGGPYLFLAESPSHQVLAASAYLLSFAAVLVLSSAVLAGRAELRRKKNQLREIIFESNKLHSIGAFAAGLAHDWNNLMLVLSFEKDKLAEQAARDPSLEGSTEVIGSVVEQARGITSDLLAFARRDKEPLCICNLNEEVSVAAELGKRALGVDCQIEVDLSNSQAPNVNAKRSYLHQVILNLVLNARDAMTESGGIIRVEVHGPMARELKGENAMVAVIYIVDQGQGMSSDMIAKVFEPLFTTRADRGGTGLGLSVASSLISDLGGEIGITSEEGQGTTVSITLPVATNH